MPPRDSTSLGVLKVALISKARASILSGATPKDMRGISLMDSRGGRAITAVTYTLGAQAAAAGGRATTLGPACTATRRTQKTFSRSTDKISVPAKGAFTTTFGTAPRA